MADQDLNHPKNREPSQHNSDRENLKQDSTINRCRELVEQLQELLEPYLDLSEDKPKNFQGLQMSMEAAEEVILNRGAEVGVEFVREALEQITVSFLNRGKCTFAAALIAGLPEGKALYDSPSFQQAAGYALDGVVKYGELDQAVLLVDSIYPAYIKSPAFESALDFRIKAILEDGDYTALEEVASSLSAIERGSDQGEKLRTRLVMSSREQARSALIENFTDSKSDILLNLFWLDDQVSQPEFQQHLMKELITRLEARDLIGARELAERFALEPEALSGIEESALLAVKREKAAIAAGYYDHLSKSEFEAEHCELVNNLIELFNLSPHLKEPVESRRAA